MLRTCDVCMVADCWWLVTCIWHLVSGNWYLVSGLLYMVACRCSLVSVCWQFGLHPAEIKNRSDIEPTLESDPKSAAGMIQWPDNGPKRSPKEGDVKPSEAVSKNNEITIFLMMLDNFGVDDVPSIKSKVDRGE